MNTKHKLANTTPWYKQFWPWFLIALPGSVVIASLFTISLAVENAPIITHSNLGKFTQPIIKEQATP